MEIRVCDYVLELTGSQVKVVHGLIEVLSVTMKGPDLVLNAVVEPEKLGSKGERIKVEMRTTGAFFEPLDGSWRFMGSHVDNFRSVWHVWVQIPLKPLFDSGEGASNGSSEKS